MESVWAVLLAIVPSLGVGFILYKVLKAILEGDRNERLAHAQWEQRHAAEVADAGEPADDATEWAAARRARDI